MNGVTEYFSTISLGDSIKGIALTAIRYAVPLLALWILIRCARSLLSIKKTNEVWAKLKFPDGSFQNITHWENLLGRAKSSDILLNFPSVSRNHAVLTRKGEGEWRITDLHSKCGTTVNGIAVNGRMPVYYGDEISVGGLRLIFTEAENNYIAQPFPSKFSAGATFFLLSLMQVLCAIELLLNLNSESVWKVAVVFSAFIIVMWLYFAFVSISRSKGFEIETMAFLLTTIGFCATASVDCDALFKQFAAMLAGLLLYIFMCIILRHLEFSKKWRWFVAPLGLLLLIITYLFADTVNGARNWIFIGPISIQPSELAKIAFIYAGTATLDRLLARRNILLFAAFSASCIGILALINDFGTAAIFFVAFVVIAFLRSGDFSTIVLSGASAGIAGFLALKFKPYVLDRFKAWRHVWDFAYDAGYQQTRTLMAIASGGLFGIGAGNGILRYVAASDTDLVFGLISEEWGILIALCAVAVIVIWSVFAFRSAANSRSSFYVIGACAATSIFCFQTMLNVFGSVDIFPLTGVTFPFLSNGGSSMLAVWGLLAFIKAVDTRSDASFASMSVKRARRLKK